MFFYVNPQWMSSALGRVEGHISPLLTEATLRQGAAESSASAVAAFRNTSQLYCRHNKKGTSNIL